MGGNGYERSQEDAVRELKGESEYRHIQAKQEEMTNSGKIYSHEEKSFTIGVLGFSVRR